MGNKCIVQKSGHLCRENSVDFSPMMMGSVPVSAQCSIWKFCPYSKTASFFLILQVLFMFHIEPDPLNLRNGSDTAQKVIRIFIIRF